MDSSTRRGARIVAAFFVSQIALVAVLLLVVKLSVLYVADGGALVYVGAFVGFLWMVREPGASETAPVPERGATAEDGVILAIEPGLVRYPPLRHSART